MTVRLDGKVALVTGATAGIGRATSMLLADRGARVVGMARKDPPGQELSRQIREAGGSFDFVQGDVTVSGDCARMVDTALEKHGRLDCLINNAGNILPLKRIELIEDEDWNGVFAPTLGGVLNTCRAALPHMQAGGNGVILNVASVGGVQAVSHFSAYGAAKAAMIHLTRHLAIENLEYGVRANSLVVGTVADTGMLGDLALELGRIAHGPDWTPPPDAGDGLLAADLIQPEDVGRAIAVLCSDDAREINAATISMDRGISAGAALSSLVHLAAGG